MSTTRTVRAEQAGPVLAKSKTRSLDLNVIVEPGRLRRRAAKRRTATESAPAERSAIAYRGRSRSGVPGVGRVVVDDVVAWVKARYHAGWRELTVTDAGSGVEVGGIDRHLDTGRRTWWAAPGRAVTS